MHLNGRGQSNWTRGTGTDNRLATENLHRLGLPDDWIYQGSRGDQQAQAGIDADGIVRTATEILEEVKASKPRRHTATRRLSAMP